MFDVFSQKNRILLRELIKTDFKLRYQGSAIGYLWSILKPLMTFTIMYIVFIRFLRLGGDVPHFPVALLLANVIWGFFSEATSMGMVSIVSRGDLLRKLNFSKHIIVLSAISGAAINFVINLVVVLIFSFFNGVTFSWTALMVIPWFFELFLMAAKLVMMNPLAQIIQDMRYFLIDKANTPVWLLVENKFLVLIPYVLPILIFVAGFAYFNKHAKKFAEIL